MSIVVFRILFKIYLDIYNAAVLFLGVLVLSLWEGVSVNESTYGKHGKSVSTCWGRHGLEVSIYIGARGPTGCPGVFPEVAGVKEGLAGSWPPNSSECFPHALSLSSF